MFTHNNLMRVLAQQLHKIINFSFFFFLLLSWSQSDGGLWTSLTQLWIVGEESGSSEFHFFKMCKTTLRDSYLLYMLSPAPCWHSSATPSPGRQQGFSGCPPSLASPIYQDRISHVRITSHGTFPPLSLCILKGPSTRIVHESARPWICSFNELQAQTL